MQTTLRRSIQTRARWALTAVALACGSASAWALPVFTFNPAGASTALAGAATTADNIIVSDFSHVTVNPITGAFTESGFLSVQSFQLVGAVAASPGLNSTYGLYLSFTGTGQQTPGDLLTSFTNGTFTSLDYTLWGYNGPTASFGFDASNNPTTSAVGSVALATGSLIQGSVNTAPAFGSSGPSFVPSANATVTFETAMSEAGFFVDPSPFYDLSFAAFTNTVSQVEVISPNEFRIRQGGGAFNFGVSPIPEPETYALMLAGLGVVGFMARRRKT